ncbi:energy transducer TonB [Flavobacterium sp. 245]|uniref:energy transducer TonB n=1 Tax=Flavobacterium sp. 245 TaxID=2512115 RepID=UPI00105E79C8|nr:energy transducer TonB [Flavobacterium sp. 245]TDP03774.1 TonB-like protein [Flavobacterium sp. 245]
MKPILSILFALLISIKLFSQTPVPVSKLIYLDSTWAESTPDNYKYTRLVEDYFSNKEKYIFKEYYKSAAIKSIGTTLDKDIIQKDGQYVSYYENGKKKSMETFSNGKKIGKEFSWYENGNIKSEFEYFDIQDGKSNFKINNFWNPQKEQTVISGNGQIEEIGDYFYEKGEIKNGEKQGVWEGRNLKEKYSYTENYKDGVLISGTSIDENNNQYTYKFPFEKPIPAKGMSDFYRYIGRHYATPKVEGLQGKVYITFIIDKDGNPTKLKIIKDIGYNTGKEAIKTILGYGKWIPGKFKGIPKEVLYSLPLTIQATGKSNSTQPYRTGTGNSENNYQDQLLKNF